MHVAALTRVFRCAPRAQCMKGLEMSLSRGNNINHLSSWLLTGCRKARLASLVRAMHTHRPAI